MPERAEPAASDWEVVTYDGPSIGSHTVHGRYRYRWLAEYMSRGLRRYPPPGGHVYIRRVER